MSVTESLNGQEMSLFAVVQRLIFRMQSTASGRRLCLSWFQPDL